MDISGFYSIYFVCFYVLRKQTLSCFNRKTECLQVKYQNMHLLAQFASNAVNLLQEIPKVSLLLIIVFILYVILLTWGETAIFDLL